MSDELFVRVRCLGRVGDIDAQCNDVVAKEKTTSLFTRFNRSQVGIVQGVFEVA